MTDYTDKGLDQYLNATSGAVSSREVSGMNFDIQNDRNIIGATKLRDFSFNSGVGGTITLGGTANGNGVLLVRDASGGTIITANNNGITITGGSISISNASGSVVLDAFGLNSQSSFYSNSVSGGSFDTTSSSPVNVTGGTLNSLVLTRDTKCLIYMAMNGSNSGWVADTGAGDVRTVVYDSFLAGTISNFIANFTGAANAVAGANQLAYVSRLFNLAAGTHILNLQIYKTVSGTAHLAGWELGLIQLGA